MDEFRRAYECTDDLPEIDFDNYTLVIGKRTVAHTGHYVSNQKIIETCDLTFHLELTVRPEGLSSVVLIHYWGMYPKLSNKPFYVKYERIFE
jgi:hypothetical protein